MADTVPGDTSSSATLVLGTATSGTVDTIGDHDWYRIALTAGQFYTFVIDGPGTTTLSDSLLNLRNAQGGLIASDDDGGQDHYSQLTFQAPTSGTYFLDVSGWDNSIGTFSVLAANAAASGADTIAADSATTGAALLGGTINGTIDSNGDHDWFAVNLTAGQRYSIGTSATGGSSDVHSYLALRDSSGLLIADGGDASSNYVSLTYTPTTSGTYYIDVEGRADASTGTYRLTSAAVTTVTVHTSGPTIILYFDAAASASTTAAADFRAGVTQAASYLSTTLTDNITLSFDIHYAGTGGGASAGPTNGIVRTYAAVSSALQSHATAGDTIFNNLPTSVAPTTNVDVWSAEAKALGFMGANDITSVDGEATFTTDIAAVSLVGVAIHELTHAMGRVDDGTLDILDMFRFTAPHAILISGASTTPPAYFSVDGGVTKLADFDNVNSPPDFLNSGVQGPNDDFNEFYSGSTQQFLSAIDLQMMDALGFHLHPSNTPNQAPVFTAGATRSIVTNEDQAAAISTLATDADNDTLIFSITTSPTNGTLSGSAGAYSYTPFANVNGTDQFKISVSDGKGGTATQTVNVTITAVNDAPVNIVPAAQTTNEDSAKVITGLSIADVDAGSGTLTVTLAVDHGKVTVGPASGGATIAGNSSASVTLTGSLTDINATLAAANAVTYAPTPNYAGANSLHFTTNDNGNSGLGGALTDVDAVAITVVAVNDAPTNSVPGAQTVNQDSAKVITGLSTADVDAGSGTLTFTLAVDHGKVAVGAASGAATIVGNNSASVTITGSLTDINATLAAANAVTYTPALSYVGADTLHVSTNDNGNSGTGGALTDTDIVGITVGPVNHPPVNMVPGAQTTNEDGNKVITGLSIADVDAGTGTLTVTLAVDHGTIMLSAASGAATITGNNSASVTTTGKLADINATLAAANAVTYVPTANYAGADTLHVTTNDNGNTGPGGAQTDIDTVGITIVAVNDTPVNTVPAAQTTNQDVAKLITGLSTSDVDAGSGQLTITLAVDHGRITLGPASGGATIAGNNSASATLTGGLAAINATLAAANAVTYTPLFGYSGADTLHFTTSDNGNSGTGGVLVDIDNVDLQIIPVVQTNAIAQIHAGESIGLTGRWNIFGDSGSQIITIGDHSLVNFRSGFNAGAMDSIRLTGQAANFSITTQSISNAVLTSLVDDISVTVPIGANGVKLVFDNDEIQTIAFVGTNLNISTTQTVAGASNVGAISPTAGVAQVHAGENIGLTGRWNIFGDSGIETIAVNDHSIVSFRSGFNAGAVDSIRLTGQAAYFNISAQNISNALLTSAVDDISMTVPIGANGINLLFDNGDSRTIAFVDGHMTMTSAGNSAGVIIA